METRAICYICAQHARILLSLYENSPNKADTCDFCLRPQYAPRVVKHAFKSRKLTQPALSMFPNAAKGVGIKALHDLAAIQRHPAEAVKAITTGPLIRAGLAMMTEGKPTITPAGIDYLARLRLERFIV